MYVQKLQKFNIQASQEEIYCSAYAAAAYLKGINFNKKVFYLGEHGIKEELNQTGIECFGMVNQKSKFKMSLLLNNYFFFRNSINLFHTQLLIWIK